MHLLMVQKMYHFSADGCHVSKEQLSLKPTTPTQVFVWTFV
jgi:hypothetical protein